MVTKMCYHILPLKPMKSYIVTQMKLLIFLIFILYSSWFANTHPTSNLRHSIKKEKVRDVVLSAGFEDKRHFLWHQKPRRWQPPPQLCPRQQEVKAFYISESRLTCLTHHTIQKEEKHEIVKGKRKDLSYFLKLAATFFLSSSSFSQ